MILPGTYIPRAVLKPYIQSFVIDEKKREEAYTVIPGTGVVIGFQYKGKLSYLDDQKKIALSSAGVTGLLDSYRQFKNDANTGTILVFFKEGGAAPFFRQPLYELFRESVSLDNFMLRSELLLLEERLCEASTGPAKINVVEEFLISRMRPQENDPLIMAALSLIHKNKGDIRISELARQLHTSQSPLEKRFRKIVGASPKKFASIVRIKNTIARYTPGQSLTSLGYEAGYYDQAHFIKEFKTFTGQTPESYFSPGE